MIEKMLVVRQQTRSFFPNLAARANECAKWRLWRQKERVACFFASRIYSFCDHFYAAFIIHVYVYSLLKLSFMFHNHFIDLTYS